MRGDTPSGWLEILVCPTGREERETRKETTVTEGRVIKKWGRRRRGEAFATVFGNICGSISEIQASNST